MKLSIKVKPNSKVEKVEKLSDHSYSVSVRAPRKEGKANDAVIAILSDYFKIPKSHIILIKGATTQYKLIQIL